MDEPSNIGAVVKFNILFYSINSVYSSYSLTNNTISIQHLLQDYLKVANVNKVVNYYA